MQMFSEDMLENIMLKEPFSLELYEPVHTISQLFDTGINVTLSYVIRNNKTIYFKEERVFIPDHQNRGNIDFKKGKSNPYEYPNLDYIKPSERMPNICLIE